MGSDDLHHKRKAKSKEDLDRRRASRERYHKVLIVCEGQKTEPLYFNEIKDYYEINSANITISGDCGSDPISVFNHAYELYTSDSKKGDAYDRVYCVFDQDSYHLPPNKYQQAIDKINGSKPKDTFFAVTSVPCFEYWLLLHFTYTTAPYNQIGETSPGKAALNALKFYWPEYTKASQGTFEARLNELDYAKANSARALKAARDIHTDNPSTYIHELVNYLQNIKVN